MALSPTEALQGRATKRMQQTQQLETKIDTALESFPDADVCTVEIENTVLKSVFDDVVARYRAAGWTLDVQLDFRGNRQITFHAPVGV